MIRKLAVEFLGTAILVFFAVGVATLMFGFRLAGASVAAGVVATALAFGLALLALVYMIGPISGGHVNPAVTVGALLTGRIALAEAVGYWIAQFVGGSSVRWCSGVRSAPRPSITGPSPAWAPTAGASSPSFTSAWAGRSSSRSS
jgi:glycerol uptake facilitator-like aquaporin